MDRTRLRAKWLFAFSKPCMWGSMRPSMPKSVHTPAYKLFLQLLAGQRKRLKWSQRELGRRMNAHHAYVNMCESGERQLNIIELRDWCGYLGISFPDFVKDLDEALKQQEQEAAQSAPAAAKPSASTAPNPKP